MILKSFRNDPVLSDYDFERNYKSLKLIIFEDVYKTDYMHRVMSATTLNSLLKKLQFKDLIEAYSLFLESKSTNSLFLQNDVYNNFVNSR